MPAGYAALPARHLATSSDLSILDRPMLRVLLTNDDGIHAEGLQTLRRALAALEDVELAVIAPDANMSATARSITTRRPLWVTEVPFEDGSRGYSCDGTPVDCVRLASLGLVEGFEPDLVVAGINHGSNLGDDITYSGTVAAALEGIVLGVPGIAVSQQSQAREMDFRLGDAFDFEVAAAFTARVIDRLDDVPLPDGTLLNINVPAGDADAVEVSRLGKRIYRDALQQVDSEGDNRRRFRIYGDSPVHDDEEGTDLAAVAAGRIAVTPLHFDLTAEHGLEELRAYDLARLLAPAAEELAE
jgi:5'/3'-nucleotidase